MQAGNNLVVIDDEPMICEFIEDVASANGFEVRRCASLTELRNVLVDFEPSVLMLDLNMPRQDGIEVLRYVHELQIRAGIVLMSGEGRRVLDTAMRLGEELGLSMQGVIEKPVELEGLENILYRNWRGQWVISEDEIARGLHEGQFSACFQPRIRRNEEGAWTVCDAEALIRWHHPRYGEVAPDMFIPVAEDMDVIAPLTELIVERAVDAATRWEAAGFRLGVSVNIPTTQLGDIQLPDKIAATATKRGLELDRLTLEVTERGTMKDAASAMDILTRCRLKKFGLSMDDFGTGYSSLTHLAQLPFNEIKIDKSFVTNAESVESSRVIIRSCIALARSLGLKVCAEGVESPSVLDLLDRLGCDCAQGYWISPPVPAEEIPNIAHNFRYQRLAAGAA